MNYKEYVKYYESIPKSTRKNYYSPNYIKNKINDSKMKRLNFEKFEAQEFLKRCEQHKFKKMDARDLRSLRRDALQRFYKRTGIYLDKLARKIGAVYPLY